MLRYPLKYAALFVASFLSCTLAFAQTALPADFMASRQAEVERQAETLYATRLDDGRWTRHDIQQCGAFKHHLFARFDSTPTKGVTTTFAVIYDLDRPPAQSTDKPWQGGTKLLRVSSSPKDQQDTNPSEDALIFAFNRAVAQENATTSTQKPSEMDQLEIARCFVSVSGNEPVTTPSAKDSSEKDTQPPVKISSILIPLIGTPELKRMEYVDFDQKGSITRVGVLVQHTP